MIDIDGKTVFETVEEITAPPHTALVVIDAQNDFCSPGGLFSENGEDMSAFPPAIAQCRKLIDAAHERGVPVIYIQNQKLPGNKSTSSAWLRFLVARSGVMENQYCTLKGSWGAEIVDELAPAEGDIIVHKWRSSAFRGTNLDMILRTNGIQSVVCCGFITQGCVESTARDAGFHDYYPVVVEDAIACYHPELHEASLTVQRTRYDVVPTDRILGCWSTTNAAAAE